MRTYTSMAAGNAAKLLVTVNGETRTIATLPRPEAATKLANHLTTLSLAVLVDATNPALPDALKTLGVRRTEVEPAPSVLRLSPLAERPAPDFRTGAAWRSTGVETVWYLAHALHEIDQLPAGPARSVRAELANLLGLMDGPVVAVTVRSDEDYIDRAITFNATTWLSTATDTELEGIVADDYGPGYGTDEIVWAHEPLVGHLTGNGYSVQFDPDATRAWLRTERPHVNTSL